MKLRKAIIALLVTGVIILLSIPARAAFPSFMKIEGQEQGLIEGSVNQQGREGTIEVYAYDHSLYFATNPRTGLPTQEKAHEPFKVIKTFDKSTPKLYRALVTSENLKKVEIKFYEVSPTGEEVNYFTILLENARIIDISLNTPLALLPENEGYRHMEEVSFVYQKITWTFEVDGIQFSDSW